MKLKIRDMEAETEKLLKRITLIYLTFQSSLVKKRIINYSNWLDLSIWMMKKEILIHKLLHMFKKQVLMLSVFNLKKFIMKVLVKTRDTHFSSLLLLDSLLIQVLNIIIDLVLPLLLLQVMMAQEER